MNDSRKEGLIFSIPCNMPAWFSSPLFSLFMKFQLARMFSLCTLRIMFIPQVCLFFTGKRSADTEFQVLPSSRFLLSELYWTKPHPSCNHARPLGIILKSACTPRHDTKKP